MTPDDPTPQPQDGAWRPPADGLGGREAAQPLGETLIVGPEPERARGRRWAVPALVAVVVLALVGGAVALSSAVRGGGAQPEDALPAGVVGFAKLDLDPSAAQKVSAFRFMRKFPQLEDHAKGEDLRRTLFEALASESSELGEVSYAKDVEPWLGQRVGLAVLPPSKPGGEPLPLVAVQVTDEDAARDGIRKVAEAGGESRPGIAMVGEYALVAADQKSADRAAADAGAKPLSEAAPFAADMRELGETGVSSGWLDLHRLASLLETPRAQLPSLLGGSSQLSGRLTYAVRFDGDDLEAVSKASGMKNVSPVSGSGTTGLTRLPGSTVAAVGIANGGDLLAQGWQRALDDAEGSPAGDQLDALVGQAEAYGFTLPDDLATLLGTSFTFAVDRDGLGTSAPRVGARVTTDATEAAAVLDKLEGLTGASAGSVLHRRTTSDGLVVASEPAYARTLASQGRLGQSEAFGAALPGIEDADFALWADMDGLASFIGPRAGDPDTRAAMKAVDAVGLVATIDGRGAATYRLRVVTR